MGDRVGNVASAVAAPDRLIPKEFGWFDSGQRVGEDTGLSAFVVLASESSDPSDRPRSGMLDRLAFNSLDHTTV